ncbi:hypothetical protein V8E52_000198 [Russula decolorans]
MDRVRDLNSLLQHYRDGRGNLTRHFSWYLQQEGPAHQSVHHATAKLHGRVIGVGSGISISSAKYVAAAQALQYLQSLPPRHTLFSLQ